MRYLLPIGMALASLSGGCALSMPDTVPYPPAPTSVDPAPGISFCARTEVAARSLASAQAAGGWTLGAIGVASLGGGTFATLVNDQESRRIAAAGLTLGGVALGIVAYNLFLRSAASSRLAEAANLAMLEKDDRKAYETCVRAKSAWANNKTETDAITREMLDARERDNKRLQEEVKELKKRLGEDKGLPPPLAPTR